MRRDDDDASIGNEQPIELFERPHHVGDVFNDVCGADFLERVVAEREREAVQIRYNVGVGVEITIETNGTRILLDAAADIKN